MRKMNAIAHECHFELTTAEIIADIEIAVGIGVISHARYLDHLVEHLLNRNCDWESRKILPNGEYMDNAIKYYVPYYRLLEYKKEWREYEEYDT